MQVVAVEGYPWGLKYVIHWGHCILNKGALNTNALTRRVVNLGELADQGSVGMITPIPITEDLYQCKLVCLIVNRKSSCNAIVAPLEDVALVHDTADCSYFLFKSIERFRSYAYIITDRIVWATKAAKNERVDPNLLTIGLLLSPGHAYLADRYRDYLKEKRSALPVFTPLA